LGANRYNRESGGLVGAVRHVGINKERELWNSLKHIDLDDPNAITEAIESLPESSKKFLEIYFKARNLSGEEKIKYIDSLAKQDLVVLNTLDKEIKNYKLLRIFTLTPEEIKENIRALSKLDLDNTANHIGKNVVGAALAAGATALVYGGIRTLVNRNKQPQSTP